MPTAPVSPLRTFRVLAGALMSALVVIGIALTFVVGSTTSRNGNRVRHVHAPSPGLYVAIVVLGVVMAVLVQVVGYRVPALDPGLDPGQAQNTALLVYRQSMILRFALSEVVAIVAIALVFGFRSNTVLPYVVGAVIAELLMAYHVWPGSRLVERVQRRLDRAGGRSNLAEVLAGTG